MDAHSKESAHHGYASELVPEHAQGSGWSVFFIVTGSLCGLPTFILSDTVFGSLGFAKGVLAVLLGTAISGVLGACSAFTGSRARIGLAMLADHAFGPWGARIVKLLIAVSLVGWFGVTISVLGATAASGLGQMSGYHIAPLSIGLPVCIGIAAVTLYGASGLERLGKVLIPVTVLVLAMSVLFISPHFGRVWHAKGSGKLDFASCVSAIVGSYIVGIVIQPDYGRFVQRPMHAALGAGLALGMAYPAILILASLASLVLGAPQLISAMIVLGFGLPALAVLLLGAWIDASASLYSASLSFANQLPRASFRIIVVTLTLIGIGLALFGADSIFIPFLMTLGLGLPPLAGILILSHFLVKTPARPQAGALAVICWLVGTLTGFAATRGAVTLTGLPVLDSIMVTALVFVLFRVALSPPAASQ